MKRVIEYMLCALLLLLAPAAWAQTYPHHETHPYSHDDPALRAQRQRSPFARSHAYLGAEAVFMGVAHETNPNEFLPNAGGFNISVGGRMVPRLAIELNWMSTFHGDNTTLFPASDNLLTINGVTFDMKVFLWYRGRVQPYVAFGGGVYFLGKGYGNLDSAGPGFEAGGGLDIWLMRHFSLGFKAQYRGMGFIDYGRFNDDTYISAVTLGADLTARF